jgi:hypothetical protein
MKISSIKVSPTATPCNPQLCLSAHAYSQSSAAQPPWDLYEDHEFTRNFFGLKFNQLGGDFRPLSERMNFPNCLNGVLPQMLEILPIKGPVVSKGLLASLSDWTGAGFFDLINK